MRGVSEARRLLVVAACLIGPFTSAAEIALWPAGVPEPRVPADPPEKVEVGADGISRRSNVSNPRLVVFDIPRQSAAHTRPAVIVVPPECEFEPDNVSVPVPLFDRASRPEPLSRSVPA